MTLFAQYQGVQYVYLFPAHKHISQPNKNTIYPSQLIYPCGRPPSSAPVNRFPYREPGRESSRGVPSTVSSQYNYSDPCYKFDQSIGSCSSWNKWEIWCWNVSESEMIFNCICFCIITQVSLRLLSCTSKLSIVLERFLMFRTLGTPL